MFHQNEMAVDPSLHGKFSAQKLMSVWKELLYEYDTVMVNFTKSGNHEYSMYIGQNVSGSQSPMLIKVDSRILMQKLFRQKFQ
jgi:hypothetical protein